jgi:hypothetical protein
MFDSFLHPWYMIAGLLLVSAPIIIHLINRMRFRRIRWAAMEFLLKSQKRNRRRLIIEQLILLALRCLLVGLAGFLVARFVGETGIFGKKSNVVHYVVIDDTPSMSDRWKEEGEEKKAFDVARKRVKDLARDAATASTPQQLKVVRLSDLDTVIFDDRLNDQTVPELGKKLDDLEKASAVHVKPVEAVKWARGQIGEAKEQRFLHLVSDLRDTDWSGSDAEALSKEIEGLTGAGARVLLVDVAHPYRHENQPVALNHDNMGISDLRPETRFAAEGIPVQFSMIVNNYSASERKGVFLDVRVNGEVRFEASQPIDVGTGETRHSFLLAFNKPGFNQISVTLTGEENGVEADNTRVAVIEVRKQVPVLMVDGGETTPGSPRDSFYLGTVFNAAKGYQSVVKAPKDLDETDLEPYPCVYLLNVPQLSEKALKRLEAYVENGGRVAVFVGDRVQARFYNDQLYKNGQGIFPVPLALRPTDKLTSEEKFGRLFEDQYQIYLRDGDHPIFREAALPKYREVFKFLLIDQTWPTLPRFQWNVDPNKVKELVTLPNRKSVEDYRGRAMELNNAIPAADEKHEKFRASLEGYQRQIRDAAAGEFLFTLGNVLERMLSDRGDPKNLKDRPDLKEFWDLPENQKLRNDLNALRETVQYGDPLVLSNRYGKGHVVAFLTTAGKGWNDWAGGCPASWTYPMIMLDLQKYLTGVGDEGNYLVGAPLELTLDAGRYEPKARAFVQGPPKLAAGEGGAPAAGGGEVAPQDLGDVAGRVDGSALSFSFANTREPGIYYLHLQPKPEAGTDAPKAEERAYVFNIDTPSEGNLKRAGKDSLERGSPGGDGARVTLVAPDMAFKELVAPRQKDFSESPWLYLIILIVLIVEQALAVHLSFHLKGNEAQMPGSATGRGAAPVEDAVAA